MDKKKELVDKVMKGIFLMLKEEQNKRVLKQELNKMIKDVKQKSNKK